MNWYHSTTAVNALAGEYVLGTLQGGARRRFEAVMARRPEVAQAVSDWEGRLHRMAGALPPVPPSPALWDSLARRTGMAQAQPQKPEAIAPLAPPPRPGAAKPSPPATPSPASPARGSSSGAASAPPAAPAGRQGPAPAASAGLLDTLNRWWRALAAPVPAGALAFGLMAGFVIAPLVSTLEPGTGHEASLPESYVGVLALPDGRPGLIVASLRHGRSVDLKQVAPITPPEGRTLFLWTIDARGQATPVGPIPHGAFVQAPLNDTAENVFRTAVELGVTLEPIGATPAQPGGPWVVRGLCGKVWRVPGT